VLSAKAFMPHLPWVGYRRSRRILLDPLGQRHNNQFVQGQHMECPARREPDMLAGLDAGDSTMLVVVVGIVLTVGAFLIASRLTKILKALEEISKKLGQDRLNLP
jgi:hypothetical protein